MVMGEAEEAIRRGAEQAARERAAMDAVRQQATAADRARAQIDATVAASKKR